MAFRDRFQSVEDFDDWLLGFYESRIIEYMDGIGEYTEHNTLITPSVIKTTMKRYIELLGKRYVDDWKLPRRVKET
jgi:hypothetical protein|tara:strand:+ start:148 stop:375 length:228 start_codon:yes stop_codon:yes gene_type:complete